MEKDRISDLPDGILHKIVSLLPMRDAIRTAALSGKCRQLGKFIPNLNFESDNIVGRSFSIDRFNELDNDGQVEFLLNRKLKFVGAVDKFFQLRPCAIKMESLRIYSSLDTEHTTYLDQWIRVASSSNIESLDLTLREDDFYHLDEEKYYSFPFHLLPNKVLCLSSLKCLSLESLIMRPHPDFYGFKSLTTLFLRDVNISDVDLGNIFFTSSLLESLRLWACVSLVHLEIPSSCSRLKYLDLSNCRLECVSINAPNVKTFVYKGNLISFSFVKVPQIDHIEFTFMGDCYEWINYVFNKVPQLVPQLESLRLFCGNHIEAESIQYYFPQFTKLKQLTVTHFSSSHHDLLWMIPLLRACPSLEEFHLDLIPECEDHSRYMGEVAKLYPRCPLKRLKTVEISGFNGFWCQIDLASRLLSNADALETMTIDCRDKFQQEDGTYEIYGYYNGIKRCRRRIRRFVTKRVPQSAKLVVL
ncbi:F-box/FBD/LRR-repeat protein [Acorus gramineus]|uniref:F-box/FBD/LRR-repeat protein n=1 Tax=Acorus gramineus TaxID=55184 RepID=A0AAV9B348_ACOGR|nr:F-box/FBD/LRR-repeat protein [Acorus gramineus]